MQIIQKEDLSAGLSNQGKIGILTFDELSFGVRIKNARFRFGHLDYLVEPLNGSGSRWVESHKVKIPANS